MKKAWIAAILITALLIGGCAQQPEEKAVAGYRPPEVVKDETRKIGERTDATEEAGATDGAEGAVKLPTKEDVAGKFSVKTGDRTVSVYQLNLCAEDGKDTHSYRARFAVLIGQLAEYNPDVIVLQEAGNRWMNYIMPVLEDDYDYYMLSPDKEDNSVANPILFKKEKFKDVNGGCFWFSDTPDEESALWSGKAKNNCTWLTLELKSTGEQIHVFNTQASGTADDAAKAAALICEKAESIGWNKPIVCGADFGQDQKSAAYTAMCKYFKENREGDRGTPTNHGYTEKGKVTDFSFYTAVTLQADSYTVRPQDAEAPVSDHNPIITQYTLRDEVQLGDTFVF